MTSHPVRVALYARVSTEEQAEHGYSIDAQLDTLRNYCKLYDKEIYSEYVDRGVSGKSMNGRLELQRLLKDAENNLFDEVLVWKINRLARKNIDLLQIVELLGKSNVAFRSFSEHFETDTPVGKFALQMMGAVGELERNTIVDNVKMGMKQRAKTGRHNGKVPLGYKVVYSTDNPSGQNSTVVVVPEEATIVQKIFQFYASGRGLKSIANELNHGGYVTKNGNAFSTSAVKAILGNPMYVGKIRFNQVENWNEKRRKGRNSNPIIAKGKHEAIIAEELWEKVQKLREKKAKVSPRTFNGEYLLTGLIRCPQCGAAMVASRTRSKLKNGKVVIHMYYSCGNFRSKGSKVCSANSIRKQDAEEYVVKRLKEVLQEKHILHSIVEKMNEKQKNQTRPLQQEFKHILEKVEQIEKRKARYLDLYELGQFDKMLFSNRVQELQAELDGYLEEKKRLEFILEEDNSLPVTYEQVYTLLSQFERLLTSTSFEQRKTLLHLVINKITMNKEKKIETIELTFNENTDYYFTTVDPSAPKAEGAFCIQPKQALERLRIGIVI